jgi:WD40 repeat protein
MLARAFLFLVAAYALLANAEAEPVKNSSAKPQPDALTDAFGDPLPEGAIARLGTLRLKHTPAGDPTIDVVHFSPDGKKMVSLVYGAASIRLWDSASGKEIPGPWAAAGQRFTAVAFSADSAQLAAGVDGNRGPGQPEANGRQVLVYDIAGAKLLKTLTGLGHHVRSLSFADAGKTLVCAGEGVVSWWDVAAGKQQRSWKPFADETQPAPEASKDGKGKKTKTFFHCAVGPDASFIAIHMAWRYGNQQPGGPQGGKGEGMVDQEVFGFSLASQKMSWRTRGGKTNGNSRLAYSADGRRVAIALGLDKIEVRDTTSGKLVADPLNSTELGGNMLGGLALSANGTQVALAGADSHVLLWDLAGPTAPPRKLTARVAQFWPNSTQCLDFAPDGQTLMVGADADVQLYDVATLNEVQPWEGHRGWIDYLAFAADGKRLLSGCADINLHCQDLVAWDPATWKRTQLVSTKAPPWPNLGIVSPDLSVFAGKAGQDHHTIYDLASGKLLARLTVPGKPQDQARALFSPAGKFYLLRGQYEGKAVELLYALPSGKLQAQLPPLTVMQQSMESCRPIAFTTDERLVALFSQDDGKIHVVDTATGKTHHRLGNGLEQDGDGPPGKRGFSPANLAFARDGKLLASWRMTDNLVRIWDVPTGRELLQISPTETSTAKPVPGPNQQRAHLAWSPDGRMLAVGVNKIRLWELASLGVRRELPGHADGAIRALSYSPDGRVLVSGSADTTVLVWDVSVADAKSRPELKTERAELAKRWQVLGEDDAARAFAAIRELIAAPEESVAWIKEQVRPAKPVDVKLIEEMISKLDDGQFKVRQKASTDLIRIGEQATSAIDAALAGSPPLETHLRLQDLRKRITGLIIKGERLQACRALEVLEHIGTADARQVLTTLAEGAPGAIVTTQARAALERLPK